MLPPFDRTALLLDLDGTLIDFAPTPDSVIIPPDLPELLHRLKDRLDGALERWFRAVGRERVLVEISEEMYASPQETFDRVTEHLGLAGHRLSDPGVHNAEPSSDLDPGLRAELAARLAPDIRATEALLGRSLPWG